MNYYPVDSELSIVEKIFRDVKAKNIELQKNGMFEEILPDCEGNKIKELKKESKMVLIENSDHCS